MHSCMSFDSLLLDEPYSAPLKQAEEKKVVLYRFAIAPPALPTRFPLCRKVESF
jgi:hypothetical protein